MSTEDANAGMPGVDGSDNAEVAAARDGGGDNLLDALRKRRNEIAQKDNYTLDLPVPGYDNELVIRYKYTEYEAVEEKASRLNGVENSQRVLIGSIDTLIEACDKVMIVVNGELQPINPDALPPVRFDERLAELLNFDAKKARDVVRGVFNNDYAIIQQAMTVSRWMTDITKKVDEAFVGES